jgi:hypothetical protein
MTSRFRYRTRMAVLATALLATVALQAQDAPAVRLNTDSSRVMVHGYDVVAYFTDQKAVPGTNEFTFAWQGATWKFASAAHRDLFAKTPEKFAPQYGGFCAWAVSRNYTADTDPEAFTVAHDRLFLNYSKKVQSMWEPERDANIAKADTNWPALSKTKK